MILEKEILNRYGPDFLEAYKKGCRDNGLDPEILALLIQRESAWDYRARSPYTNATGFIGFMPATAEAYGTNVDDLREMRPIDQLPYIWKHFKWIKSAYGSPRTPIEYYLSVFYPLALKYRSEPGYFFGKERSVEYARKLASQNKIFDLNKDGIITMKEFEKYCKENVFEPYYRRLHIKSMTIYTVIGLCVLYFLYKIY